MPTQPTTTDDDGAAVYDIQQLSRYVKVPVATLYQWRSRGGAPAGFPRGIRLGRRLVYRKATVDAWLIAMERGETPPAAEHAEPEAA